MSLTCGSLPCSGTSSQFPWLISSGRQQQYALYYGSSCIPVCKNHTSMGHEGLHSACIGVGSYAQCLYLAPCESPPSKLIVDGLLRSRVTGNIFDALLSCLQGEEKLLCLVISERILGQQSLLSLLISNHTIKPISDYLMDAVSVAEITLSRDLLELGYVVSNRLIL